MEVLQFQLPHRLMQLAYKITVIIVQIKIGWKILAKWLKGSLN